jgi:hypothetical protein
MTLYPNSTTFEIPTPIYFPKLWQFFFVLLLSEVFNYEYKHFY